MPISGVAERNVLHRPSSIGEQRGFGHVFLKTTYLGEMTYANWSEIQVECINSIWIQKSFKIRQETVKRIYRKTLLLWIKNTHLGSDLPPDASEYVISV